MPEDKVIHAFPSRELPDCPVAIERGPVMPCMHPEITINEHERAIRCSKCDASLDAFDYLRREACAIRRGWEEHRYVMQLVKEKREQIEALDKQKKRLQGQIRTLNLREKK